MHGGSEREKNYVYVNRCSTPGCLSHDIHRMGIERGRLLCLLLIRVIDIPRGLASSESMIMRPYTLIIVLCVAG